jgi:spermidine/putrescine transport system substrate-binding protein
VQRMGLFHLESMMKKLLSLCVALGAMSFAAGTALADGELNIYNWGNYTSPEMIKKFEDTYKVKVTITDYDSNDTALAKIRAGGHGFDIVVPSASFVPIYVAEGLLEETKPNAMENFKNVDPLWVDVPFDRGRKYTVPWQWGTTGIAVNTKLYSGEINTSAIFLDPPAELVGKINVIPELTEIIMLAVLYHGGQSCTDNKEILKKVRDNLVEAKPKWLSMDYSTPEAYAKGDIGAGVNWNGYSSRARLLNPDIKFAFPKEGFPVWMDNVAVIKGSKNLENAKLFQNFIMDPQNAAMISNFARYRDGIAGSQQYYDADLKAAPEINMSEDTLKLGQFSVTCSPATQELYAKIWTEVAK